MAFVLLTLRIVFRIILVIALADFLAGTIGCAEALSKTNFENALQYLLEQQYVVEKDKRLTAGSAAAKELVVHVRALLPEVR